MKTMFTKKHLAVLMLTAGGLASGSAFAVPVACNTTPTIADLIAATDGCFDQDKIYTGWTSDLPGATLMTISTLVDTPVIGLDTHRVSTGSLSNPAGGSTVTYTLSYTISVDTIMAPNAYITTVSVGADVPPGTSGVSISKTVTPPGAPPLTWTDGVLGDNPQATFAQSLAVSETITLAPGAAVFSTTDTYVETVNAVPEPASLVLMGLGLAGLGVWRRRKA